MSAIAQQAQVAKTVAVSTGKVANAKSMMVWRPHGNKYVRDRDDSRRRRLAFFSSSRGHRRVAPDLDRVREPSEGSAPSSAVRVRATRRDRARCVGLFSFVSAIAREGVRVATLAARRRSIDRSSRRARCAPGSSPPLRTRSEVEFCEEGVWLFSRVITRETANYPIYGFSQCDRQPRLVRALIAHTDVLKKPPLPWKKSCPCVASRSVDDQCEESIFRERDD